MILDRDIETRDEPELELEPESNTGVLINPETLTAEELDLNSMVVYNIAEYNVINQVLLANKSSPSLEPLQ